MSQDAPALLSQVIRDRRTVKVFADSPLDIADVGSTVEELLDAASWAPFHYRAAEIHREGTPLSSVVPWRFHLLDGAACRTLREKLLAEGDKTKIPAMLAAATTLIQVTWLPNPPEKPAEALPAPEPAEAAKFPFEGTAKNMENIAATAAAIQNLLLAATARGIPSYWSSGAVLSQRRILDALGIPGREILLGAVFLFPPGSDGPEVATGGLRNLRGTPNEWSRWVELD